MKAANVLANIIALPRDAVLTKPQLAAALHVSERQLERLDVPVSFNVGTQSPRYVWGQVLDELRRRAAAA